MHNNEYLTHLHEKGILSSLDIHFAGFITGLAGKDDPALFLAAALVSSYKALGHICLDLSCEEGKPLLKGEDAAERVVCPELGEWQSKLEKSSVVGRPGQYKPLILDDRSRLYLYRYWEYQEKLSGFLKNRVHDHKPDIDIPLLKKGLARLFPGEAAKGVDWQKVAAFSALTNRFCVISGGPGTGKTTTVAKIIALILEQAGTRRVRISLAAPTGKAASRLQEAVKSAKNKLTCSEQIKEIIPSEASTIHRLLGSIPDSPYFRHNAQNTLPVDVVIVDEASMVDMALMSKLVQALAQGARLILLGDKDQLASVEAGAVLGDICDSGNPHGFSERFSSDLKEITGYVSDIPPERDHVSGIRDCIVQLRKSYRFGSDSGIGAASRAVNTGDNGILIKLLKDDGYADIKWKDLPRPDTLPRAVRDTVIKGFEDYLKAGDPWEAFNRFERFRILCALRKGPYGVSALNLLAEQSLAGANLIDPSKTWYSGRPVLITRNDYNLRLFNGDVGIVLPDPEANNDLRVFFPAVDGALRRLHPLRLPEHETVYAMTVHKSQGSEFDKVLLILPDKDYPVLTRELIYTGITRAREGIEIWSAEDVFRTAVLRRTERTSGLRDALWEE
ncbi:MAG: exodeoxyribonuclease V subunit alpha [Deltaproteobacteria bacterium]|nr:exodeoxyribonuclease V subunit alpha [Deltaproteobacteria bacterium]